MTTAHPAADRRAYTNSAFPDLVGVRTHVLTWGPEDATTTVVGLHHFYGSAQTYHRLGGLLAAAGVRLVALDRVGFGLTERPDPHGRFTGPDSPYTRAFAVRQVLALCERLGVDRPVVTGTSMGGTISLELALAHPDRVAHVVPCSAPLTADASPSMTTRRLLRWRGLEAVGTGVVRRLGRVVDEARVARSWHDPTAMEAADVDAHARFLESDDWARGLWWKFIADERPSLLRRLPELAHAGVPVTAVGATHDRTVPARIARRVATETGGRYVEVDAGHVVHAEGAAGLAEVLRGIAGAS